MMCSACSTHVENAVRGMKGVRVAEVSLLMSSMTVEYDEDTLGAEDIIATVAHVGYHAEELEEGETLLLPEEKANIKPLLLSLPLSVLLMQKCGQWEHMVSHFDIHQ